LIPLSARQDSNSCSVIWYFEVSLRGSEIADRLFLHGAGDWCADLKAVLLLIKVSLI